jgi:hypothetical protein
MKKIYIWTMLLLISLPAFGVINYVSAGAGPVAWNVATSWIPNGIPTTSDNVTIAAGNTITINTTQPCHNLTINGTLAGSSGMNLQLSGNYTVNGTVSGNGSISFFGLGSSISGSGTFSTGISFTFAANSTRTITAGTTIVKTGPTAIATNAVVTNLGTVTLATVNTNAGATWINSANSSLTLKNSGFMTGRIFTANAVGNTVTIKYTTGAIPITTSGYNNLTLAGASGIKTLASSTIIGKNLTVNSNNTLNSNNFDLTVKGNWLNNGTFTASTGKTVTFNGTVAQTVSNTTGTTTFKGLAVNNNAGVTLTTGIYILDEVLTVSNGTFNTGGRPFTMTSTAVRTARIAPIVGSGAIAGNFTIERFISTRDTTWSDLSSPVQSSTFLDWDNELPGISYSSSPPASQASAATYNEAADKYVAVTSSGTSLNAGQGFEVFLTGGFTYTNFPTTTMNTFGVPNQGDFDLSASISNSVQGWNLVGNPFACNILWSSIYSNAGTSGLYDYIEMYDYTIADWAGYTSASGIEIGATQGFWVYGLPGNGAVTLNIPESSKTATTNSSIKSNNKLQPYFTLKLGSSDGSSNASHSFKVAADANASDGLDNMDIPFRASLNISTPQMYSFVEGKKININTFNLNNDNYSLPLRTQVAFAGNYKIEASGFNFISDYTCIKLEDKLLNKTVDLISENVYSFQMSSTDNADRFIVHFSKNNNCKSVVSSNSISSDFSNQIEILPSENGNVVNFNLAETTNSTISAVNLLGQTIVEGINVDATNQSINIALPENFSGMYLIRVASAKGTVTKKFVRK